MTLELKQNAVNESMGPVENNLIRLPSSRLPSSAGQGLVPRNQMRQPIPVRRVLAKKESVPTTLVMKRGRSEWQDSDSLSAEWEGGDEGGALGSANPWDLYKRACQLRGYQISCLDYYV